MTMASINKETRETESKTDKDEKETTKQRNNGERRSNFD